MLPHSFLSWNGGAESGSIAVAAISSWVVITSWVIFDFIVSWVLLNYCKRKQSCHYQGVIFLVGCQCHLSCWAAANSSTVAAYRYRQLSCYKQQLSYRCQLSHCHCQLSFVELLQVAAEISLPAELFSLSLSVVIISWVCWDATSDSDIVSNVYTQEQYINTQWQP